MDQRTDRWVRSDDARRRLRDLMDEVASDSAHIYVLRYDKPVAVIVPPDWYETAKALIEGSQVAEKGNPSP